MLCAAANRRCQAAAANCLPNAWMSSRVATTLRTNTSGCPTRRCEVASSRVDSSSSGTQKLLISPEILRIRPRSINVLGICGQGSSSEIVLAMLSRQPALSSRQNPAFFVRCVSSSEGLRLRIWSRPPSISTQATCGACSRGLACCSGNGNSHHAFVCASHSATRSWPIRLVARMIRWSEMSSSASSFKSLPAC
jgi:hypothetical protein